MESRKIRRGIESRHARSLQVGPNIGRVARLRDTDDFGGLGGSRRIGMREAGKLALQALQRRAILTWSVVLSLITVVVVGSFMMFWLRAHRGVSSAANPLALENVRITSKFASPAEDEALDLVKRALALRDPTKVHELIHCGSASPDQVIAFFADSPGRDGKIESTTWLSSMDTGELLLDGVLVVYAGKVPVVERLALLTPDDTGVWKLDFEAFARTSPQAWKDLLDGRTDRAVVRIFCARDGYFNGPFLDENQWVCYGMVSPESNELLPPDHSLLHGYCRVGSPQATAMGRVFSERQSIKRMTLELSRVPGADSRQYEITRVMAEDWVRPAKSLDEKFAENGEQ